MHDILIGLLVGYKFTNTYFKITSCHFWSIPVGFFIRTKISIIFGLILLRPREELQKTKFCQLLINTALRLNLNLYISIRVVTSPSYYILTSGLAWCRKRNNNYHCKYVLSNPVLAYIVILFVKIFILV